jgi:SpoVK/Ycf46/Vps4 family AAA+-type ATPase
LQAAKTKNKALVLVGCRLCLPPELERDIVVIEFALPGKDELAKVLHGVLESAQQDGIDLPAVEPEQEEALLGAASGLTTMEAENGFALSVVEAKALDPVLIAREKAQAVKKSGLLELVETKESLDSIGGLDLLKSWLVRRKHAFSQKARNYGLPTPKGLLIMGIPGTGKSLTAKATAAVF